MRTINSERDIIKVRVHDGIVGLLYIGSMLLTNEFGFNYIYCSCCSSTTNFKSYN